MEPKMTMVQRRSFLRGAVGAVIGLALPVAGESFELSSATGEQMQKSELSTSAVDAFQFVSPSITAEIARTALGFASLCIDGLGKAKTAASFVKAPSAGGYCCSVMLRDGQSTYTYRTAAQAQTDPPAWSVMLSDARITIMSNAFQGASPFLFDFDLERAHPTVLGVFREDRSLRLPALMHVPGQGSIRITANVKDVDLTYVSGAGTSSKGKPASLSLPAATAATGPITYTLDVTAIYPDIPGIRGDARFDPFRRNWLNVLQLNPSRGTLANNTASDTCAFCYYEYADIAARTPELAPGLHALDVVKQTLARILGGENAYGMTRPGKFPGDSSDTLPSLILSAAACASGDRDDVWLRANYQSIQGWADKMLATDRDGNGLMEYVVSGNSGIWHNGKPMPRPSNWWDTIGFGHEDAYGNALAYRALNELAQMAKRLGKRDDAARYKARAKKIRDVYYKTFYNPETGVLGGWRSADGTLHDYYFMWVNGIAIHYGLVTKAQGNAIMDKLLAKMREVGYSNFNMGLPGNLITVPLKDYYHTQKDKRWGGGLLADNSDGFQIYENGGATGCFVYFTLAALYDLGRRREADEILFAMLGEYGRGGFEGRGPSGKSNDWRMWDGTPMGYEGFLTDNYYTLLAVLLREHARA